MWYREQRKRIEKTAGLLCSGYQKIRLKAGLTCMFAAAWWGILYPELCFTEETFQAVTESEDKMHNTEEQTVQQISCQELLKCTGEDIVVRSRLIEWLEQYMED